MRTGTAAPILNILSLLLPSAALADTGRSIANFDERVLRSGLRPTADLAVPAGGSGHAASPASLSVPASGPSSRVPYRSTDDYLASLNRKAMRSLGMKYRPDRGRLANIPVQRIPRPDMGNPVIFTADMDIDADGAGRAWRRDRTGQPQTSLSYGRGQYLNPEELPFIVLPIGFERAAPGVKLGDLVAVTFKGKTAFAIYGDRGPKRVLGEGSIKLAKTLGINPDPNRGGTSEPVTYIVFPGSRPKPLPRTAEGVEAAAKPLLERLMGGAPEVIASR